jgi:hypothetical protein
MYSLSVFHIKFMRNLLETGISIRLQSEIPVGVHWRAFDKWQWVFYRQKKACFDQKRFSSISPISIFGTSSQNQ